jgi:hypothetical protein
LTWSESELTDRSAILSDPTRGSTLWAIPQGGDIIRQRTPSGYFSDEVAFQPEFEAGWTSAIPAARSGGWILAVSTADLTDGGYFERLVHDRPDDG